MIDCKKTKTMIFNFTEKYQFGIKLEIGGTPIEMIDITQLLGTIIMKELRWDQNGQNKINFKIRTISFVFCHDFARKRPLLGGRDCPLGFRANLYIFGISGARGIGKHTEPPQG